MGTTPREKLEARFETFEGYVDDGEIDAQTAEAVRELVHAYDESNVMITKPQGESHRSPTR